MERIRRGIRISALLIVGVTLPLNALLNVIGGPILAAFAPNNPEVLEFAKLKLLVNSMFYFLAHLGDMLAGAMRSMGKSMSPMLVSVFGICGVRILWIYTVFAYFHQPIVIFLAYAASWTVTAIAQFVLYCFVQKKIVREWSQEAKQAAAVQ